MRSNLKQIRRGAIVLAAAFMLTSISPSFVAFAQVAPPAPAAAALPHPTIKALQDALNGQGIGTAMTSLATAQVQRAGARVAFLAWLTRVNFYARLGYKVWHAYQTATRAS